MSPLVLAPYLGVSFLNETLLGYSWGLGTAVKAYAECVNFIAKIYRGICTR